VTDYVVGDPVITKLLFQYIPFFITM